MIRDKVTAGILTIIILYFTIRVFAVIYGVFKVIDTEIIPADTTYHKHPELDRRELFLKFKIYADHKVKVDSIRR
jgi:hypothetical protein